MLRIAIINGPNLNLLGSREPSVYGSRSFEDYTTVLKQRYPEVSLSVYQSNVEGELINSLHACRDNCDGVLLNAGGYTHTSIALSDAVAAIGIPVVEVHISNVFAREDYRKTSFIAAKCIGSISGLGLEGYSLGIRYFLDRLQPETA